MLKEVYYTFFLFHTYFLPISQITQLSSSDMLSAPSGCLQYYKEDRGHIESFNYRDTTEIGITRTPSYLVNNIISYNNYNTLRLI